MKITKIHTTQSSQPVKVGDCSVEPGYIKAGHGSLPDIDSDFDAERRGEVKSYLERRYNKNNMQRVFAAGTFTTIKIKTAINDVARTHKVPIATTRYITAMLEDDEMTWTDLMKLALTDKRVRSYINKYPEVFEEMLPLMGQARAAGVHASAFIITPEFVKGERVDCYDMLPVRKMGEQLVSEISGAEIDAIGILKNDVLGIRELTRLSDMLGLIEKEYGAKYTILQIASQYLNEPEVFNMIKAGNTQGVFQMGGQGITRYIKQMGPDNINDLIASVALFRPGTLNSGAAQGYVDAKNGMIEPEYLWGTYDILKDTFGFMCFQEQVSMVTQKIGNLSLGEGVNLVKALSKKKLDKVRKFKDKYFAGANENGCPIEVAEKIWKDVELAAKYAFNKSHATAYGLTAYVGAWLKTHYPTPFYTVILRDQDEDKLGILMNEITRTGGAQLMPPDINISGTNFVPDYKNNKIYWSIARIKMLGPQTVNWIVRERQLYGEFANMEEFIHRIFRQKLVKFKDWDDPADGTNWDSGKVPVNARHIKHLIMAGAFDKCENIQSVCERYGLLTKAADILGFELPEKDFPKALVDKHYFWSQQQVKLSGIGYIDFQRVWNNLDKTSAAKKYIFLEFKELDNIYLQTKRAAIAGTIVEISERTYKSARDGKTGHMGKITLQQNTYTTQMIMWDGAWTEFKPSLYHKEGSILAAVADVKYSDYDGKNILQATKGTFIKLID